MSEIIGSFFNLLFSPSPTIWSMMMPHWSHRTSMAAADQTLRNIIEVHARFYFLCQGPLDSIQNLKNKSESFMKDINDIVSGSSRLTVPHIKEVERKLLVQLKVDDEKKCTKITSGLYIAMHEFFRTQQNNRPFPDQKLMTEMLGIQSNASDMIGKLYNDYCAGDSQITLAVSDFGETILQGETVDIEHPSKRNNESVLPSEIHPGLCLITLNKMYVIFVTIFHEENIDLFSEYRTIPFFIPDLVSGFKYKKGNVATSLPSSWSLDCSS